MQVLLFTKFLRSRISALRDPALPEDNICLMVVFFPITKESYAVSDVKSTLNEVIKY